MAEQLTLFAVELNDEQQKAIVDCVQKMGPFEPDIYPVEAGLKQLWDQIPTD